MMEAGDNYLPNRRKKNEHYDRFYFPKSEEVSTCTNISPDRFPWVLHPNQLFYDYDWCFRLVPNTEQFNSVIGPLLRKPNIHIKKVFKISNRYMERQYELKKEQKKKISEVEEYTMYHYTTEDCVDDIIIYNFDWRLSGTSTGHKYGYGVSFSPDPKFAEQFCMNGFMKIVFVVKVLVSASTIGERYMELPESDCDTTISPKKTVYVKFEDSEFLPQYVIYYYYKPKWYSPYYYY